MNARRTLWLLAWAVAFVPFAACTGEEFTAASGGSGGSVDGGDCPPDRKLCDGACVPLDLPGYGCARDTCAPCDLTNASAKCEAGACAVDICVGSFADCDLLPDNGCEVNLNSSAQCGVCGVTCPTGQVCNGGQCADGCGALRDCDGGCVDVMNDVAHCGGCGARCAEAPPGATALGCSNGSCSCPNGRSGCDLPNSDGLVACVDLTKEPRACGSCSHACEPGEGCAQSQCTPAPGCAFGLADCGGACVSLESNPLHCGSCGNACPTGTACRQGSCEAVNGCTSPYKSCTTGTGAEVTACFHPLFDSANCNSCGIACGGGQACVGGVCLNLQLTNESWTCQAQGKKACKPNPHWPVQPGASWFCHSSCPWGSA